MIRNFRTIYFSMEIVTSQSFLVAQTNKKHVSTWMRIRDQDQNQNNIAAF